MNGEAPTLSPELLTLSQQLKQPKANARQAAVEALVATAEPDALRLVIDHLAVEDNDNLRKTIVDKLKDSGQKAAIAPLELILVSDEPAYIRRAAAVALGHLGQLDTATAVHPLGKVLEQENADASLLFACAEALARLGSPDALDVLARIVLKAEAGPLRAAIATLLGKSGQARAVQSLTQAASDKYDKVRLAALTGLTALQGDDALPVLVKALFEDPAPTVKARAAEQLGTLKTSATLTPLCRGLLELRQPAVQASLVAALEARPGWQAKTDALLALLKESEVQRAALDEVALVRAIRPTAAEQAENAHALTDYLIAQTHRQPDRLVGCLAALIVESASGSLTTAGERANIYQTQNKRTEADLQQLRIEIGGKTALDPMLQLLQADLQKYFREPIARLNDSTQTNWAQTIRFAQYAFIVRAVMSVMVFLVGLELLVLASLRIMFGQLDTTQLFGTGVSFVSGLSAMLLIVYSGPLREIRNSMNELGIASAAFIAYIHRVLQISHTYSYYYLSQRITFDEMRVSSELIEACMNGTIAKLAPGAAPGADELIEKALEKLSQKDKRAGT